MDDFGDGAALEKWEIQLRKGSVELAVLAALTDGQLYGLDILRTLEAAGLPAPEGTIYPLLNRLKAEGLVTAQWVESEAGHPRKYYSLSDVGRRRADGMADSWRRLAASLDRLLNPETQR